jgi:hypothetical protein
VNKSDTVTVAPAAQQMINSIADHLLLVLLSKIE